MLGWLPVKIPVVPREAQLEMLGALPPPPGITPNFVNPPSTQTTIIAIMVACLVVTTVCVALRLYTKLYVLQKLGWEDRTWELSFEDLVTNLGYRLLLNGMGSDYLLLLSPSSHINQERSWPCSTSTHF